MAVLSKGRVCGRSLAVTGGFESCRRHGYLSVMGVVCCRVEASASADRASRGVLPNVSACNREALTMRCPWPTGGCCATGGGEE